MYFPLVEGTFPQLREIVLEPSDGTKANPPPVLQPFMPGVTTERMNETLFSTPLFKKILTQLRRSACLLLIERFHYRCPEQGPARPTPPHVKAPHSL
jgi:hypothetical protein